MRANILIATVLVTLVLVAAGGPAKAEEKKIILNVSDGIREVLTANIGKRVSVKTDSGEVLEGSVVLVGNQLVHLEKLTGKDFYDAVISIDRISSLTLRARGN